jgi:Lipocalin-like domain
MNQRSTLAMATTALVCLAVALSASNSIAQQKSLKEQLVGIIGSGSPGWEQIETVWEQSEGLGQIKSEADGLIVESIAYYGTYTVNEEVNVISLHLDASTFPNQVGTDQKRIITSLTAEELKYNSPAPISGVQVHQIWNHQVNVE